MIERSYLVDPKGTEDDLYQMNKGELAAQLRVDYESGRLRENFETLSRRRIIVEPVPSTFAGGVMSSATAEESR